MKKILLIIPVIICFVFSNLIILPATAESVDPGSLVYYPLPYFQEDHEFNKETDIYLYAMYKRNESSNITYAGYIQVKESEIKSLECIDGIYHIEFVKDVTLYSRTNTDFRPGYSDFASEYRFDVRSITYQPGLRCYFFNSQGEQEYPIFLDCIFYDIQTNMFNADPTMPDVTAEFYPDLSGEVDRTIISDSGSKSLLQELKMKVTNNSPFPVQYRMTISLKNQITKRHESGGGFSDNKTYFESRFDDDPIFVYYSNADVYQVVGLNSSQEDMNVQDVAKYRKPTDWHYLNSGQVDEVTFDFSMINLTENCEYVCKVVAYKCDYDCASSCIYSPEFNEDFPASPEFKQVDTTYHCEAYYSSFIMLQYSDIKYDPNKKSDNVLPYDGSKGISFEKQYKYTYDSKTDPITGDQQIGHVDLYNDPNSWINKKPTSNSSDPFPGSSSVLGNVSATSFSGMFANVFGFVSMFMNYLPSQIMSIFIFGFSCIVVIAIIKAVR